MASANGGPTPGNFRMLSPKPSCSSSLKDKAPISQGFALVSNHHAIPLVDRMSFMFGSQKSATIFEMGLRIAGLFVVTQLLCA